MPAAAHATPLSKSLPLSLVVSGTGTDVGKTVVTAALLRACLQEGLRARAVKIVQTGIAENVSPSSNGDCKLYGNATDDLAENVAEVLHTFPLAASPHLAAALCNKNLSAATLIQEISEVQQRTTSTTDVILFETAGGLKVPLNSHEDMLCLLGMLGFPVLLTAANTLGTLNHTLLSLDALKHAGLPVAALLLTETCPPKDETEQRIRADNRAYLERTLGLQHPETPLLSLPCVPDLSKESWNVLARTLSLLVRKIALDLDRGTNQPDHGRSGNRPERGRTQAKGFSSTDLLERDRRHIWHPYTSTVTASPLYPVRETYENRIVLTDGRELIDGMSSWWSAIHGYRHPHLEEALITQAKVLPHVMFGGLTHEPAIRLGERLLSYFPGLSRVFFADSGSVAVEVAMKMALQYHQGVGNTQRTRFLTPRGGYHGDTFGAMSVCDPVTGMHTLFSGRLMEQCFMERPRARFDAPFEQESLQDAQHCFEKEGGRIAAVILEPIVQGAGGMWFYHPRYLDGLAALCKQYGALLIFDEIATGFGHTGKLFASDWLTEKADILCLGKALTGGTMTLAATLASEEVARGICARGQVFMHGPTFMANPLACSLGNASLDILEKGGWQNKVALIEKTMREELQPATDLAGVRDVRVLGDIGVVETKKPVDVSWYTRFFTSNGVWIRPFAHLLYIMPPYISPIEDVRTLCRTIVSALKKADEEGL
ncbi:MAG: adenosylmethionine--8-amino-7-oxononanoate transaminase [Desulfovibrio sp.]|nr:adenosylmethionine--8-amino-7-oxononanoate transaminase [Desulfovibrio sp.]